MRAKIEKELMEFGIRPKLKGFSSICEAVEILINDLAIKITTLYSIIAQRTNITEIAVERRIRYAISKLDLKKWESIGGFPHITNAEFLCTLTVIVRSKNE